MIITIDGPASSGKSTTAKRVASEMGFAYLDTGAMYRAVALEFIRSGVDSSAEKAEELLSSLKISVTYESNRMEVWVNGEEVTKSIRAHGVGEMASRVSTLQLVRDRMTEEQRRVGSRHEKRSGGVVLDGRDTGSVVFPEAELKIFLVATLDERALRRKKELDDSGEDVALEKVRGDILERDCRDWERDFAPLKCPEDAIVLDNTGLSVESQVALVIGYAREVTGR
jgi:cytidylate kinase